MAEVVVADAGPLIALARLDRLSLLSHIFDRVLVPQAVFAETQFRPELADALAIAAAASSGTIVLDTSISGKTDFLAAVELGRGESEAIALAVRLGCGILIDDKQGRNVASSLSLQVIGTVGVLVIARNRGLVSSLKPLLEELRESGYRLSEQLIQAALTRVGEQ